MPAARRPAQNATPISILGKKFVSQAKPYAQRGLADLLVWFEGRPCRMSWARVKSRLELGGGWAYMAKRGLLRYLQAKVELHLFTAECKRHDWGAMLSKRERVNAPRVDINEMVDGIVALMGRRRRVEALGEMLDAFGLGGERRVIDELLAQAAQAGWKAVPVRRQAEAN